MRLHDHCFHCGMKIQKEVPDFDLIYRKEQQSNTGKPWRGRAVFCSGYCFVKWVNKYEDIFHSDNDILAILYKQEREKEESD